MQPARHAAVLTCMDARIDPAKLMGLSEGDAHKESGSQEGHYINGLTIDDALDSVTDDMRRIRNHPLVNRTITIYGYMFDVHTGKLIEVTEATKVGRALLRSII